MKRLAIVLLSCGLLMGLSACLTGRLWDDTNPNGWVRIDAPALTEQDLSARGVAYRRDSSGNLFIPKTSADRFKDYSLRALGAPVTVVVDAAGAIGTIVVIGLLEDLKNGGPVTTELIRQLAH